MWKLWLVIQFCSLTFLLLGCIPFHQCMQTRPSCSIEPYHTIEFNNYTEEARFTYIQRMYDGEPLGEAITNMVEAKTTHKYRVPPGYYELGQKNRDGTYQVWRTGTKDKWMTLGACATTTINMADKKVPRKEFVIRPRLPE